MAAVVQARLQGVPRELLSARRPSVPPTAPALLPVPPAPASAALFRGQCRLLVRLSPRGGGGARGGLGGGVDGPVDRDGRGDLQHRGLGCAGLGPSGAGRGRTGRERRWRTGGSGRARGGGGRGGAAAAAQGGRRGAGCRRRRRWRAGWALEQGLGRELRPCGRSWTAWGLQLRGRWRPRARRSWATRPGRLRRGRTGRGSAAERAALEPWPKAGSRMGPSGAGPTALCCAEEAGEHVTAGAGERQLEICVEDLQGRWDSGGRRGHGGPAGGHGGHWPQRCFDHWQVRAPRSLLLALLLPSPSALLLFSDTTFCRTTCSLVFTTAFSLCTTAVL